MAFNALSVFTAVHPLTRGSQVTAARYRFYQGMLLTVGMQCQIYIYMYSQNVAVVFLYF